MAKPHDHRELWDESDVEALLDFIARGFSYEWIAEHMGRTRNAISSKLYRLRRL